MPHAGKSLVLHERQAAQQKSLKFSFPSLSLISTLKGAAEKDLALGAKAKGRGLIAMSWDRTQCLLKSRFRQPWGGAEDPGQQETVSQNLGWGPEAHSSCPPPPGDAYVIT